MDSSSKEGEGNKKVTEVKTFQVPFALRQNQKNISIISNTSSKQSQRSKEQIINQAIQFHLKGNISEASKYYKYCIKQGFNHHQIFTNYGAILQGNGKLEAAEISLRKAIEIKPDFADAHSNLGNILRDLGKLEAAEISLRKAIKINPNFADAHYNLGVIFKDLDNLLEAELSYRKAIKINPNFADAHYNLGIILRDLGKLQEAELSYRKAIEINPDFADAHYNLGVILQELGKLQELILLSKSTLESTSINQEYKLLSSLRLTIANLLQKDYSETLLSINKTNYLINQGAINTIKDDKNKNYTFAFSSFITSLYPLLEKDNNHPNSKSIPHIGESHCLSFAHQTLSISSQIEKIQPVLITGGKAWHFTHKKNNRWKDSLNQQMKNHIYNDKVFISFGEIDCRKDEGILNYAIKNDKDISEVCEKTIKGYLDYMEEILSPNHSERYYFGVPAPTREKKLLDKLDIKRIKMIELYNSFLKEEVLSRNSFFLDVYRLTANENGENNNIHMCDKTHLSPKCLSILFKNHLYQPDSVIQ